MSIRTNPMKAVTVLLKRVKTARSKFHEKGRDESFDTKLENLMRELNRIDDLFIKVKKNQDALLDTLHQVDSHLRKLDRERLDQDMDVFCKRIRDCAHRLLPMDSFDDESCGEKSGDKVHLSSHDPSTVQLSNHQLVMTQPPPLNLNLQEGTPSLQDLLKSLSIFPVNAVIKKTQAFYLWTGLRLIHERQRLTAQQIGKVAIHKLLKLNVIIPYGNGQSPIFNKFILNPHFRHQLESLMERQKAERLGYYQLVQSFYPILVLDQQKVRLGHGNAHSHEIYNISANYLSFESNWTDKLEFLEVLQLGRWQDSPSHHIEVASQDFLKDLTNLKHLRFLSLRGISRIFELSPSVAQLESLLILDLKACHNLETLPDDISSMKNLTHLILSQCYLLDGMPKGIDKLTKLQVLKGFLLGSPATTACSLSDLSNLKDLRRLSIRIRAEAVINDAEFESLRVLPKLEHLKISWGVSDTRFSHIHIILPPSLKKLHLECFPGQEIPEWLKPSNLPRELQSEQFKELKLTGGNLTSMNHNDDDMNKWKIEIVHLKYLRHLEVDISILQKLFPLLRYAEIRNISNHSHFEWSIN